MTDDAERCAVLLAESFPEGGSWSADDIRRTLARPGGRLFEVEGGFMIANTVLDEAEIWTIAVHPTKRRKGRARALLVQAMAALADQGVRVVHLEVAADNVPARALYDEMGFVQTGARRAYYRSSTGEPVDAILMQKALS